MAGGAESSVVIDESLVNQLRRLERCGVEVSEAIEFALRAHCIEAHLCSHFAESDEPPGDHYYIALWTFEPVEAQRERFKKFAAAMRALLDVPISIEIFRATETIRR